MKKNLLLLIIAVLCCSTLAGADNVVYFGQRFQQQADDLFDWGQFPETSLLPSPSIAVSVNGNSMTFGNLRGDTVRVNEGTTWIGSFDYGESLLWTGNPDLVSGTGLGPLRFTFANPVASVGFTLQSDNLGTFQY